MFTSFARKRLLKRIFRENSRIDDFRKILPGVAFLALVALGLGYVFTTPPFQVPDEPSHFLKSYELAQGHCATAAHARLPNQIVHLADRFERANAHDPTLLRRSFPSIREKLDASRNEFVGSDLRPADVYSCLPYAIQAMAMVGARAFDLSPIFIFYAGRMGLPRPHDARVARGPVVRANAAASRCPHADGGVRSRLPFRRRLR